MADSVWYTTWQFALGKGDASVESRVVPQTRRVPPHDFVGGAREQALCPFQQFVARDCQSGLCHAVEHDNQLQPRVF